jgi:hypothetical protein
LDVISFQIETLKKLLSGKALAVPDLSVFLSLFVAESIVAAQVGVPLAIAGYEEMKKRGWVP